MGKTRFGRNLNMLLVNPLVFTFSNFRVTCAPFFFLTLF
jgi:hypothetical protein